MSNNFQHIPITNCIEWLPTFVGIKKYFDLHLYVKENLNSLYLKKNYLLSIWPSMNKFFRLKTLHCDLSFSATCLPLSPHLPPPAETAETGILSNSSNLSQREQSTRKVVDTLKRCWMGGRKGTVHLTVESCSWTGKAEPLTSCVSLNEAAHLSSALPWSQEDQIIVTVTCLKEKTGWQRGLKKVPTTSPVPLAWLLTSFQAG